MEELTPMMQQYMKTKEQYQDCILFYRLGDFYEMFFEDALTASKELEITLTGKNCGMKERAPMCGVPYHAVDSYLNKLVSKGYKVAICEQVEDPKLAKGIVKREVIRIVTPGTNLDTQALDEDKNNYLMCIFYAGESIGISIADVTTGDYDVTEVENIRQLLDEINKYMPSEIICNEAFFMSGVDLEDLKNRLGISLFSLEGDYFDEESCQGVLMRHFQVASVDSLGVSAMKNGLTAAGALLQYLYDTQKNSLAHMTRLTPYTIGKYMLIDTSTRRNLELTETLREKQKRGSLLWVLDKTKTAMGARMLRKMLEQPSIDRDEINNRLDAVEELFEDPICREELREYMQPIYDFERLLGKISYQSANPRDLIALKLSMEMLPPVRTLLADAKSACLKKILEDLDPLEDLRELLEKAIVEDPPLAQKDGGIIREGYHEEVDRLRTAKTEGKTWLANLEKKERESTGIKNLRIRYNKVFGYYLEVTNSFKNMVPEHYMRKQTLANAERYITPELKEMENTILGAEERLISLEYELFCQVRNQIARQIPRIQKTADAVARLDFYASLANVADQNGYVRPKINERGVIDIRGGRHPVVEKMLPPGQFVENDTFLNNSDKRVSIITGPNMAGKSTYMRQSALIVLMAQIGSFVPARQADIGLADRIFTRVGASDDLASGQSTFMVEMTEVANILRNATPKSLLILDEIGRGTSTFDGLSIAWAVVEHISNRKLLGAKTLFATHYHELTELEGKINGVNNYCIAVKEQGDNIVFLRKIIKGGADKSYGIQVAKLAGVPDSVIQRAKDLVEQLSDADISYRAKEITAETGSGNRTRKLEQIELDQMTLFDTVKEDDIIKELQELEIGTMTPLEALNKLNELQNRLKNRW